MRLDIDPGVFIPRPQTQAVAVRAAGFRPALAVDLFAGCGAIACLVKARNPDARVVAGELDPVAVACARRNGERFGVEVFESDVDDAIPRDLEGRVDVLTANVPYVPTGEMSFVPHDGEPVAAFDGGPDGLHWVDRVFEIAPRWLRRGGVLLMEVPATPEALEPPGFRTRITADRVLTAELQ